MADNGSKRTGRTGEAYDQDLYAGGDAAYDKEINMHDPEEELDDRERAVARWEIKFKIEKFFYFLLFYDFLLLLLTQHLQLCSFNFCVQ